MVRKRPELAELATPRLTKYIAHGPEPKQAAGLLMGHIREVLYGGAAGGGKSDWLLMGALQYADVPGYGALIVRKTYTNLAKNEGLIPRSHEWLGGTDAYWNGQDKHWTFPSGARLEFGHLENANSHFNYQGPAYQYVGFDEATEIPEYQARFLIGRTRRLTGSEVPIRIRYTANPIGPYVAWVHRRFIVEGPGNVNEETGEPQPRVFIPAFLSDNPHLDAEDYLRSMAELDPHTREAMLRGVWMLRPPGSLFKREWFPMVRTWPGDARRVRYWDLAATEEAPGIDPDWTAGCLMGFTKDVRWWLADMRRMRGTPGAVRRLIKQQAMLDGPKTTVVIQTDPGQAGKDQVAEYRKLLAPVGCPMYADPVPNKSKLTRAEAPSSYAEAGSIMLVQGDHRLGQGAWITPFLDEVEAFDGGKNAGMHDDQVDAFTGAWHWLRQRGLPTKEDEGVETPDRRGAEADRKRQERRKRKARKDAGRGDNPLDMGF